jgi:hypothetical protein
MSRLMVLALIVTVALGGPVASAVVQQQPPFPNTKKNGSATVEFMNDGFYVVANYDYSQRNHDMPWLLIVIAAASAHRFTLTRKNIKRVTPGGRELPIASQEALLADTARVTSLQQNAKIFRRPLDTYFCQRGHVEQLRF